MTKPEKPKRLKFVKSTLKLQENHTWAGTPGHKVIVLDRGAMRFEYPEHWVMLPDSDSFKLYDRRPPKDDCCLAVSYLRLPPDIDWSGISMKELVEVATAEDSRPIHFRTEPVWVRVEDMDLAWRESYFDDPKEHRAARSRLCIARRGVIQALITFEFWEDEADRRIPVWDNVLSSLRLNDFIPDPTKGPWGRG
jgi:hypothetical protein